MKNRMERSQ